MKCYDRRPHFVFVHEHDIMSSLAAPALLPPRPASRPPPALLRHAHRETHPSHATRGLGERTPGALPRRGVPTGEARVDWAHGSLAPSAAVAVGCGAPGPAWPGGFGRTREASPGNSGPI